MSNGSDSSNGSVGNERATNATRATSSTNGVNTTANGVDTTDCDGDDDDDDGCARTRAISVEDVSVRLGDTDVLDAVSLTVDRGQLVGLVGPNGAGKTTLLRTINGLLDPDAGTVRLAHEQSGADTRSDGGRLMERDGAANEDATDTGDDRSSTDAADPTRTPDTGGALDSIRNLSTRAVSRRVATVPQDTALSFGFPVREVVAMGRTPHRSRFESETSADRAAIERAMERTQVAEFAERSIEAVSGGERQRVVLARAIAQETPILALDEPTASLDINHQVRTLELVADLVDEGHAAIAAIHDLELAARYCDILYVLSEGSVLAGGPPENVLTEETIERAFDTRAAVVRHPVTGAVDVTALPGE